VRKKLQSRHVEIAVQTDAFECLTKSSDNDGVRRLLLKVDNPICLDVLVSNNSSLLHHKIHKLGRTQAVHKINYLPDLQKRKERSSRRMKNGSLPDAQN